MDFTKIHFGRDLPAKTSRKLQVPLWLFMLFVPFATFASVILIKHAQTRHDYSADFAAIQGDWQLVQLVTNGETRDTEFGSLAISGNVIHSSLTLNPEERVVTFAIDPHSSPKTIVFRPRGGHGIYSVDRDKLTLCLTDDDTPRPNSFRAEHGDKQLLLLFLRTRN